jgi:UDP-4-amino-4,6-dideoxy-N-acetyl-beta-L-altrosamine N-acetyltransferase
MLQFLSIKPDNIELILNWRTDPEVTRYMFSDVEYNLDNQKKWYQKTLTEESSKYWMISYQQKPIGVINLSDIDYTNRHCTWGYYIGEAAYRSIGGIIPPYLYNYVFNEMRLHKITAEVMDGNCNLMKLHEMHGYRLVGKKRDDIRKYDTFHDVFVYELLYEKWKSLERYKNCVAMFSDQ